MKPTRTPISSLRSAALRSSALLLTVLMTACGGGSDTPGGTVPSGDTFEPYSAVTDTRTGAYLLQTDGSYLLPVNGTLEIMLGRKSDTTGQISLPASYQLCSKSQGLSGSAVGTAGKFTLTMQRFNTDTFSTGHLMLEDVPEGFELSLSV